MPRRKIRVYYGPDDSRVISSDFQLPKRGVKIPLGELLTTLVEAVEQGRSWTADFRDEEVTVSTDLYEVILAYQHYRRPSA